MTHLVVIVADTFREPRSVPGCDPAASMPFLSELASRGASYPSFVSSAPWTIPSHVSLLTGRPPWSVVYAGRRGLGIPTGPSLADAWRSSTGGEALVWSANGLVGPTFRTTPGYDAWNLGSPRLWAAERVARALRPVRGPIIAANGIAAPAGWFEDPGPADPSRRPSPLRRSFFRAAGAVLYACTRTLLSGHGPQGGMERTLRRRKERTPLHLLLNLMETHEPYALPRPADPGRLPAWLPLPLSSLSSLQSGLQSFPEVPPLFHRGYAASLRELDERLRGTFEALHRAEVLRDALVVLVSDHGQSLGDAGRYGHGNSLADELVRVPCLSWRFRDGRPHPSGGALDRPFDHRHLHDALVGWMRAPEEGSLVPELERALEVRGTALAFREGSPSTRPPRRRGADEETVIARGIRVVGPDLDRTVPLVQLDGRLSVPPGEADALPSALVELLRTHLREDGEGREVPGQASTPVDRRLSAWGYV